MPTTTDAAQQHQKTPDTKNKTTPERKEHMMDDLTKIGHLEQEGKRMGTVFHSARNGTYHIYDSNSDSVCAEPADEEELKAYAKAMKNWKIAVIIEQMPQKPTNITLATTSQAWDLIKTTLLSDIRSKAFDPTLRHKIVEALGSITKTPA